MTRAEHDSGFDDSTELTPGGTTGPRFAISGAIFPPSQIVQSFLKKEKEKKKKRENC